MRELEPDVRQFTHDRQYRTIGWKVLFETLKKFGEQVTAEDTELTPEERTTKVLTPPGKTILKLGFVAANNMPSLKGEIIDMVQTGSPYINFIYRTSGMTQLHSNNERGLNTDMLTALKLFYSAGARAKADVRRFKLDRFDDFIRDPDGNVVEYHAQKLTKALGTGDADSIFGTFDAIQRDGDLYAGLWDRDRMTRQTIVTRQLPDQPSQMPQSSLRQLPEPPDTLRASA